MQDHYVVKIFNGDPYNSGIFVGTAFFINSRYLLTAKHVINDCKDAVFLNEIPRGGSEKIPKGNITFCKTAHGERDIALIKMPHTVEMPDLVFSSSPIKAKDEVNLSGFDDASQSIKQRTSRISGRTNSYHLWEIQNSIAKGYSGGPVIREGELIGVISARDTDKNIVYCVPTDDIKKYLPDTVGTVNKNVHSPELTIELQRARDAFVGRKDEIQQLHQHFSSDTHEPIAITAIQGMAGVGKSWLADHYYATHKQHFGGYERLTLNIENLQSPEQLLGELVEKFNIETHATSLLIDLRRYLHENKILLHIENVDSNEAATLTAKLCQQLPTIQIIITGRLEGIGKSQKWHNIAIKPFGEVEAIAQLEAELKWLDEKVNLPTPQACKKLVNTLGKLPLAIHLAAGYLASGYGYTVDEFLEQLKIEGFTTEPSDPTDDLFTREQARAVLKQTFQISLTILEQQASKKGIKEARQTFAGLAHTSLTGFGISIAAALTTLEAAKCRSFLRLAQQLSLIELISSNQEQNRWQLHPLLSEYLKAEYSDNKGKERLHEWFLSRLPETENTGEDTNTHAWHELNSEHIALAEWLTTIKTPDMSDVERAGSEYAMRNGPFRPWMSFCEVALKHHQEPAKQSDLLFTLVQVAQRCGEIDIAYDAAKTKDQIDTQEGNERESAIAKGQIADILQARGNLDEALRIRNEEQLPVYEKLGDVREIAITKGKIADILQARGNLDEALRIRNEEQLPVYEKLGDVREIAITKGKIADILQARGNLDEALRIRNEEQLPVYEKLGDVSSIAITKGKIADILQARGNLDEALRIRQDEELPVYEKLGDVSSIAITKGQIADILQARGNLDEALRIRQDEELPVYEKLGEVRSIAITKGQIADILQARGNLDEALRIRNEEQLPIYEKLGDVREIAITKGQIADILFQTGDTGAAIELYETDVLPIYETLGDKRITLVDKVNLAQMYLAEGKQVEKAVHYLNEARLAALEMQIPEAQQIKDMMKRMGIPVDSSLLDDV